MIEEKIILAIADAKDTEPANLDLAVQNWIEMDAIRQLVNHDSTDWMLQFEIPNHTVTVTGENEVLVDKRQKRTFC